VGSELRLVCTGDLHLGRSPSRAPAEADDGACSPRGVWERTVDLAVDREADAVVVTGDIVDEENEYIEAYGVFEREVIRLDDAGIPILIVSGNHDWDLVPDMVDDLGIGNVRLLGRDGNWERHTLDGHNGARAHIDGWSFPAKQVTRSPLSAYEFDTDTDDPVIGVAHIDLDATESRYAPVRTAELRGTGADAWLLGHIHVPGTRVDSDPLILYPGSPQGLDPGEPGCHGPWEVTVDTDSSATVTARQQPLAKLRYDTLSVDVSGVDEPTDLPALISERARDHVQTDVDVETVDHVVMKLTLTGRTSAHTALRDYREDILNIERREAGVQVTIGDLTLDTRPDIDLENLADSDGPAGYLAELLLSIQEDAVRDNHSDLVDDAADTLEAVYGADAYRELRRERDQFTRPDEEDAVNHLEQQAQLVLDKLVQQVEGDV